jgi:putative cell wall-binding protein
MYSEPATDSDVPSRVPDSGSTDNDRGWVDSVPSGRTRYDDYSSGTSSTTTSSDTTDAVKRVAGQDRYATMAGLVMSAFTSSKGDIVASGTSFADALAAAALAGAKGWPVVITDPSTLSADASSVLSRLGASEVTVVGGPAAVSDAVVSQLGGARVSGTDRYATAIEAMRAVRAIDASSDTVVIATGSTFADALSVGPWAWTTKSPILLALPDGTLRQDVIDAIKADAGIKRVMLIGGPSVVSDAVRGQLGDGYTFERLGGADRYATSSAVASWAMSHGLGWKKPVVATGKGFADALAAAAVCGQNGSVLLLADSASAPTLTLLRENASKVTSVMVAGGTAAVSETVDTAVREALR